MDATQMLPLERTLGELDHVRLMKLLRRDRRADGSSARLPVIEQSLDDCTIVPSRQLPPDVVTMYSQVLLRDTATGERQALTLCYPHDAEPAAGLVSVLSPVGSGLLGRRVGSVARWPTPAGIDGQAEIVAILFQPKASGDYSR